MLRMGRVKRNHIRTEFNGHGDAETVVKAFKSTHEKLDPYPCQILIDGPYINWKIVEILKQYRREEDTSSLMPLELRSCELHVLHRPYQTVQSKADWNLVKMLKNLYSVFKKYPAKRLDYQEANDLQESHKSKSTAYLYSRGYFVYRWLGNGKAIKGLI